MRKRSRGGQSFCEVDSILALLDEFEALSQLEQYENSMCLWDRKGERRRRIMK